MHKTLELDLNKLNLEELKAYMSLASKFTKEATPTTESVPTKRSYKKRRKKVNRYSQARDTPLDHVVEYIEPLRKHIEKTNLYNFRQAHLKVYGKPPVSTHYEWYDRYCESKGIEKIPKNVVAMSDDGFNRWAVPLIEKVVLLKSINIPQAKKQLKEIWEKSSKRRDVATYLFNKEMSTLKYKENGKIVETVPTISCIDDGSNELLKHMLKNLLKNPQLTLNKPIEGKILKVKNWSDFLAEFMMKSGDYAKHFGVKNKFKTALVGRRCDGRSIYYK